MYSIGKGKERKWKRVFQGLTRKTLKMPLLQETVKNYSLNLTERSLKFLRYRIFHKKVATTTTAVTSETLPPTSNAAMFHSHQTYHQT